MACWVCDGRRKSYRQQHHVVGEEQDKDLSVQVCRGCHYLITLLARRKFLADPHKVANLITLARLRAGLPDARTIVQYEETK